VRVKDRPTSQKRLGRGHLSKKRRKGGLEQEEEIRKVRTKKLGGKTDKGGKKSKKVGNFNAESQTKGRPNSLGGGKQKIELRSAESNEPSRVGVSMGEGSSFSRQNPVGRKKSGNWREKVD